MPVNHNRGGGGGSSTILSYIMAIIVIVGMIVLLKPTSPNYSAPKQGQYPPRAHINMNPDIAHLTKAVDNSRNIPAAAQRSDPVTANDELPTWTEKFWTPVDVGSGADPRVTLCKLDFHQYFTSPHLNSMFKDLTAHSNCGGSNSRTEKLSKLLQEIKDQEGTPGGRVIPPTGFVFHESRVGSTLVANSFASDPWAMTFSESSPMAAALMHCSGCTEDEHLQFFRDMVTLMGRSPFHKHMFFKFQSATTKTMEIALKAFPDTPWAFIYRNPVQTMMSHLDPRKGGGQSGAVCLRSQSERPKQITDHLKELKLRSSPESWCAAHLNMLCTFAEVSMEKYGVYESDPNRQRGMLINYESLPGAVPNYLLPMFGVEVTQVWLDTMSRESQMYSKSRGSKVKTFTGDSQDKEDHATEEITNSANLLMQPLYEKMNNMALAAVKTFRPDVHAVIMPPGGSTDPDWKAIKSIPTSIDAAPLTKVKAHSMHRQISSIESSHSLDEEASKAKPAAVVNSASFSQAHSSASDKVPYAPWNAFSNTHSSVPFDRVECPPEPPADYPKHYKMTDIVGNWNPDITDIPAKHYDSVCHFDYQNRTQLNAAYAYQAADKPFVIYNNPDVDATVKKWGNIDYLKELLGPKKYRTETAKDNHFMYWRKASANFLASAAGKGWTEPTQVVSTSFQDWYNLAVREHNHTLENREHQYFRVTGQSSSSFLFDELPFFKPVKSLFMVQPDQQRGIHCRFGMRSVTAEAHFDGSRNAVVMLGGLRRWIMSHPNQCENMHMLKGNHPSSRHTAVDWSKPDLEKYPDFKKLTGHEVILQPGDFLYVPTYWLHSIVSLNVNYQCNTRSGMDHFYDADIHRCGFG